MKIISKRFLPFICTVSITLLFSSCLWLLEDSLSGKPSTERDLDNIYTNKTSKPIMIKLDKDEDTVTLNNLDSGDVILYASYNNCKDSNGRGSTIPLSQLSYIKNTQGLFSSSDSIYHDIWTYTQDGYKRGIPARTAAPGEAAADNLPKLRHFVPHQKFSFSKGGQRSPYPGSGEYENPTINNSSVLNNYPLGKSKEIWVDCDKTLDKYSQKNATLRAIGEDSSGNPVCLVWVVKENFTTSTSKGEMVNQTLAQNLADTFALHYAHERAVFGKEWNYLFDKSDDIDYSNISDTGSLVNIVIYDIGNDYDGNDSVKNHEDPKNECGVAGYFYAKDYYKNNIKYGDDRNYSNAGKYFYIDAAYCNYSGTENNTSYYRGNSDKVSDSVISTLFHEFQHMINFGQKTIYGTDVEHWYNEMLSMLAEDMMQEQLGISDEDSPKGTRLPAFNQYYYLSGIDEYREDEYSIVSYSTAYTFGAWLAREFGGPEFVSRISRNHYNGGMGSIIDAIEGSGYKRYSSRELFKLFIGACVFRNDFAEACDLPSLYNDNVKGEIEEYGFKSSMKEIDLFSTDYGVEEDNGIVTGPSIIQNELSVPLRPHGFVLKFAGIARNSSVTLEFSKRKNACEDIMIFVQRHYKNHK